MEERERERDLGTVRFLVVSRFRSSYPKFQILLSLTHTLCRERKEETRENGEQGLGKFLKRCERELKWENFQIEAWKMEQKESPVTTATRIESPFIIFIFPTVNVICCYTFYFHSHY